LGVGNMGKLNSFRDLRVYQELKRLHIEVHEETLKFPRFELHELGSQLRRSSNSAPANLAEGWGSRHTNIYIESVNRAMGEIRETQHHLSVAHDKAYLVPIQLVWPRIPRNEFLGYLRAKPSGLRSFQSGRTLPACSPGVFPAGAGSRTRDNPGPECGVLSCKGTSSG